MSNSPLVKATLQATALATGSNIIAQFIEAHQKDQPFAFDVLKLFRFMILNLIATPPNYKWQQFLERTFPGYEYPADDDSLPLTERNPNLNRPGKHERSTTNARRSGDVEDYAAHRPKPKLNMKNTFLKWFIDCMTVGTVANTIAFLVIMGGLKAHNVREIWNSVQKETVPIILAGYRIWPIASIISFSFVPVERRIVFLSSVGFLWGIYMSLVATRI